MIGMRTSRLFFNSPAVMRRVDSAKRIQFMRFGKYVRTTAKRSIGKRKAISRPGSPPSSHKGQLRRFIFYRYEPQRATVVIGPEKLPGASGDPLPALEYGGQSTTWVGRRGKRKKRRVTIASRPYMTPAFDLAKEKLPEMWNNSVKA